jgi:hypothetical protein
MQPTQDLEGFVGGVGRRNDRRGNGTMIKSMIIGVAFHGQGGSRGANDKAASESSKERGRGFAVRLRR